MIAPEMTSAMRETSQADKEAQREEEEMLFEASLLSRVLEPCRFTLSESRYSEVVTLPALREELDKYLRTHNAAISAAQIAEELADLDAVWKHFSSGRPIDSTFRALLDFDLREFPVITSQQRRILDQMTR